jgi:hypothetical protein
MVNAKNPIVQFTMLKDKLTKEIADLEVKIARIEQDYQLVLPDLVERRDEIKNALFDGVKPEPVELKPSAKKVAAKKRTAKKAVTKRPAANTEAFVSHADQIQNTIREHPGASKQDLRELLPSLNEAELKKALDYCSKKNLIENRGTKPRPQWFLV